MSDVWISLENPHAVFFSPGSVAGSVSFSNPRHGVIPGVSIRVFGVARNKFNYSTADYKWVSDYGSNELQQRLVTQHKVARGDNVLIDLVTPLSSPLPIETPGKMEFPFQLVLPPNLPCSFSGYYGKINYLLEAQVNIGAKSVTKSLGIVVLSLYDLNAPSIAPLVMTPISETKEKEFGVFESAGKLKVEFYIPKSGFVPGEVIPISGRINNKSSKTIKCIEVRIVQRTQYRVPGVVEGEIEYKSYSKVRKKGVAPFSCAIWNRSPYYVPSLPPSEMPHTNLIKTNYQLVIDVIPSGMAISLATWIDIIIGHVPLRSTTIATTGAPLNSPPVPSAPPESPSEIPEYTTPPLIENVKFLPVPPPLPKPSFALGSFFDSECGKEVCKPRYPTFMLNEDTYNVEDEFEFV